MAVHQVRAADELVLPWAGLGEVGVDDAQVGVQTAQRLGVGGVLVDGDELAEILLLKPRDEVLADETGSPGDHNFSLETSVSHVGVFASSHSIEDCPGGTSNAARRSSGMRQGVRMILPTPPFSAAAWASAASLKRHHAIDWQHELAVSNGFGVVHVGGGVGVRGHRA